MFNFFHSLAVGIVSAIAAFTGAFNPAPQSLITDAVPATSTSSAVVATTTEKAAQTKQSAPIAVPAANMAPGVIDDPQIKIEKCKIAAQMSIDEAREAVLKTAELTNTTCMNTYIEVMDDTMGTAGRSPEVYNSIVSKCHDETQNKLNILRTQLYNQAYLACLSGN